MGDTVAEIVTREVLAKVGTELDAVRVRAEQVIADAAARVETEARARLDAAVTQFPASTPVITEDGDFDPVGWIKAQAASRAWRTLLQGIISAVVIAFGTAVVQSIADPGFDYTSASDWKIAIGLGVGAVGTALVSLVQNKLAIKPPKVGL
ncbi:hypothetical protein [Rhodococcus sp. B10]|uniref:hypothetical protein n=1 Tax=Rhodococcus sp. B10 TaxID=2695876 RepID=UPI00142FC0FE|nr:hypothetical protein [Rhodococcus sp. B10]NIL77590.1 hypothetical protein [Rhodococcus sp. B10]